MKKNEKSSMKKTHTLRDTMRVTALNVTAINTMNFISYCKQREFNVSSFVTCRLMFNFTWAKYSRMDQVKFVEDSLLKN